MHVSQLTLDQLDYWVGQARQLSLTAAADGQGFLYVPHPSLGPRRWSPTRMWSQGGPIIEEARIDLNWDWERSQEWTASMEPSINAQGKTVLEAAMRAYVIARCGEKIS